MLKYKNLFYLLSVSFQISGAFLLAYMGFIKKIKNIAEEAAGFVLTGKDINSIPIPQVANKLLEIYLTRVGFILVFLGYVLSIFGERGSDNFVRDFFKIIAVSSISSLILLLSSYKLVNKRKGKIEEKCRNNLPAGTLFLHETD